MPTAGNAADIAPAPPPGGDNGRSGFGGGLEDLAMGDGLRGVPRAGYSVTWYPNEIAGIQGHHLEMVREDFNVSAPIWRCERDLVSLSAGVRNELIDSNNLLTPVTGLPFPDSLWNIQFGAGYSHQFDNNWIAGLNVRVGSASDEPFSDINQVTVGATGSLRIPVRERDALIFTLTFSNNTDFANNIPIPGVAYLWWPSDSFRALIGIPFAHIWYQPIDKLWLDLSYRFPYTVQGRLTYGFAPRWKVYAGYSMADEGYFLAESPQDEDRLFYAEQRVYGGLSWYPARYLSFDLTSGLAFDRFFSEGRNFRENQSLSLPVGAGPFVAASVQWRF
jgi:hypothetical protein